MSTQKHKQSGEFRNCCCSATNWQSWRRLLGVASDVSLKWSFATWSVFPQNGSWTFKSNGRKTHTWERWNNRFCEGNNSGNSKLSVPRNWWQTLAPHASFPNPIVQGWYWAVHGIWSSALLSPTCFLTRCLLQSHRTLQRASDASCLTSAISKSNALVATTCLPWHQQAGVSWKTSTQQRQCGFKQYVQLSKLEFLNATPPVRRQVQRRAM